MSRSLSPSWSTLDQQARADAMTFRGDAFYGVLQNPALGTLGVIDPMDELERRHVEEQLGGVRVELSEMRKELV